MSFKKKFGIICLFLLFVLIGFCPKIQELEEQGAQRQAREQAYFESLDEKGKLKYLIRKELKGKVSTGKDKLRGYQVDSTENGYDIIVTINANEYLTENEIIKWVEKEMTKIYLMLYKSEYDTNYVQIQAYFPTMDQYGNLIDQNIYTTEIDKEIAQKINWDQDDSILQYQILPKLWNK